MIFVQNEGRLISCKVLPIHLSQKKKIILRINSEIPSEYSWSSSWINLISVLVFKSDKQLNYEKLLSEQTYWNRLSLVEAKLNHSVPIICLNLFQLWAILFLRSAVAYYKDSSILSPKTRGGYKPVRRNNGFSDSISIETLSLLLFKLIFYTFSYYVLSTQTTRLVEEPLRIQFSTLKVHSDIYFGIKKKVLRNFKEKSDIL